MEADPAHGRKMRLVFPATEQDVRNAVRRLTAAPPLSDLPRVDIDSVEIVVVEALNNIVEHAYPDSPGDIDLCIEAGNDQITVEIIDTGKPLPDLRPPEPRLPDHTTLPEGGFGWFLIHSLTTTMSYLRDGNRNVLRLGLIVSKAD